MKNPKILLFPLVRDLKPSEKCTNSAHARCFKNGAVATDDERCSVVGANILRKGGSAADAAIATLLCQGQGLPDISFANDLSLIPQSCKSQLAMQPLGTPLYNRNISL